MSITNCDEVYLKKYNKFIEVVVNKFIAKGKRRSIGIKEDLLQEAQMILLKWIKKQKCFNFDVSKSYMDINKALYEYVKQNTGIHMDIRKFPEFCAKYQSLVLDERDADSFDFSDIDYKIDVEKWEKTLSPKQQKIFRLKSYGFSAVEINKIIGGGVDNIITCINGPIRRKYNAYFHPEQNPAPTRKRKSKSAPTAA